MSYRCDVCRRPVPPGEKRRLHVIKRPIVTGKGITLPGSRIEAEFPICRTCEIDLQSVSLAALRDQYRRHPIPDPPRPSRPHIARLPKAPPPELARPFRPAVQTLDWGAALADMGPAHQPSPLPDEGGAEGGKPAKGDRRSKPGPRKGGTRKHK